MSRRIVRLLCAGLLLGLLAACGEQGGTTAAGGQEVQVERLPDVRPNLPDVPTLPPPPHPVQYADNSYSVYGLRARARTTMDTEVAVQGYIVEIYAPPECEDEDRCPPAAAPHHWVADTLEEADQAKRLMVVGYAENQSQIDEAVADARRGRTPAADPDNPMPVIPVDFAVGAKVKVNGRFTRISGMGFNSSEGLLDYRGHEIVAAPAGEGS